MIPGESERRISIQLDLRIPTLRPFMTRQGSLVGLESPTQPTGDANGRAASASKGLRLSAQVKEVLAPQDKRVFPGSDNEFSPLGSRLGRFLDSHQSRFQLSVREVHP